jgi:hypothetical protein
VNRPVSISLPSKTFNDLWQEENDPAGRRHDGEINSCQCRPAPVQQREQSNVRSVLGRDLLPLTFKCCSKAGFFVGHNRRPRHDPATHAISQQWRSWNPGTVKNSRRGRETSLATADNCRVAIVIRLGYASHLHDVQRRSLAVFDFSPCRKIANRLFVRRRVEPKDRAAAADLFGDEIFKGCHFSRLVREFVGNGRG